MAIELADDPKVLRQQLEELLDELKVTKKELAKRDEENATLRHRLEALLRRFFGPRSEKIAPGQLPLAFLDEDLHAELLDKIPPHADEAPDEETPPRRRKKRRNGRAPLPAGLPRDRVVHEPEPEQLICPCCGKTKERIGEEISEEVEFVPSSIRVIEHVRPKYACGDCQEGVVIADPPPTPIVKGRPGPGLLAQTVVSKYGDHLPLNRQTEIFGRHGLRIHRSTLCDWVGETAKLLRPIVEAMKREIFATGYVNTDDTPVRVHLGKGGPGKTQEGRIWIYTSAERGEAVYDFTVSHSGAGPQSYLSGFAGYLQADAYKGYDAVFVAGDVVEVGCMAHCRRKFFEARSSEPESASLVLAVIRALYHIEATAKAADLSVEERLRVRQVESVPLLESLGEFLRKEKETALPKSPYGQAVTYAVNQWEALIRYTTDGRLGIDNNLAEQGLRRIAVGRTNWLFAGSPAGGKRAAILYSLIESCRLQEIDAFTYLRDVLRRLHEHPMSRISELTPRGWRLARDQESGTI
jgi:transposase